MDQYYSASRSMSSRYRTPPVTFPQFVKFPPEIRDTIWRFTYKPQILDLEAMPKHFCDDLIPQARRSPHLDVPMASRINNISRELAKEDHRLFLSTFMLHKKEEEEDYHIFIDNEERGVEVVLHQRQNRIVWVDKKLSVLRLGLDTSYRTELAVSMQDLCEDLVQLLPDLPKYITEIQVRDTPLYDPAWCIPSLCPAYPSDAEQFFSALYNSFPNLETLVLVEDQVSSLGQLNEWQQQHDFYAPYGTKKDWMKNIGLAMTSTGKSEESWRKVDVVLQPHKKLFEWCAFDGRWEPKNVRALKRSKKWEDWKTFWMGKE